MMSHYDKKTKQDFLDMVTSSGLKVDTDIAWHDIEEYRKNINNGELSLSDNNNVKRLFQQWYDSISSEPDYSVYGDPYYICDLWVCWTEISRQSIRKMCNTTPGTKVVADKNFVDYVGKVDTIVDLGCGVGFTSAYLREIFDCERVVGTNIKDTWQFNSATEYGKTHNFSVVESITDVKTKIDVVFASEYFEHIIKPIEHLIEIINCSPKFIVVNNAFNYDAIGHFNEYIIDDEITSDKETNLLFNKTLKKNGYKQMKKENGNALFFNNHPVVWQRIDMPLFY